VLGALKAHRLIAADHAAAVLEIQALTRRAQTRQGVFVVNEIPRGKALGSSLRLVAGGGVEPGVAFAEQDIGHIAVDLRFE
jgi:hypothetical protein